MKTTKFGKPKAPKAAKAAPADNAISQFQKGAEPVPVTIKSESDDKYKQEQEERDTQSHMDALMKAEEIKNDPSKMKRVHALAGRHVQQLKGIRSIQDIKNTYNQKFGSNKPDDET